MEVDHHSPVALYRQLADLIRDQVRSGELAPRAALPSESWLCQRHGLGRGTVRRAMQALRDEGVVYTLPQRGTYVADPEPAPEGRKRPGTGRSSRPRD